MCVCVCVPVVDNEIYCEVLQVRCVVIERERERTWKMGRKILLLLCCVEMYINSVAQNVFTVFPILIGDLFVLQQACAPGSHRSTSSRSL